MELIRKKLQVFVSSTFSDLVVQRQSAVEAILTAGHIPAGMELFTAGNESQMDVIKQWIDESDIYLVILGGRYGSLEPKSQKSYTQLEYEYAVEKGKPIFACVINEPALENRIKGEGSSVIERDEPKKMRDFRELVLTRIVRFWDDSKDIKIAIGETLSNFSRRDDLKGWVRESEQANLPALADEVARLSKENSELRVKLTSQSTNDLNYSGLNFTELEAVMTNNGLLRKITNQNRSDLIREFNYLEGLHANELTELVILGIFELKRQDGFGTSYYSLSNEGKTFLNKLSVQNLSVSPL